MSERLDSMSRWVEKVGIWLLAAIFLTLPMNALRPFKSVAIADLLIAIFLPVAIFLLLTQLLVTKRPIRFPRWLWAGALLLIVSVVLVEVLPSPDPQRLVDSFDVYRDPGGDSSVIIGIRLIFALVMFPVLTGIVVDRGSTIRALVSFWIAGVSISCAAALSDALFGFSIQATISYDPEGVRRYTDILSRMVGLTDHPNTLSLTAVMVIPLVMARMKTRRGLLRHGPLLILMSLGVLLSGARIGVVGLVTAAGLTLMMDHRFRRWLRGLQMRTVALSAGVFVIIAAVLFLGVYSSSESGVGKLVPSSLSRLVRSDEASRISSDSERESFVRDSVEYIKERPLQGYGYQYVEYSHNTVLQLALAGGIFALIGFFLVLLGYLRVGFGLRSRVPVDLRDLSVGLTISLLTYVLSGLVVNHTYQRYLYIPAGLIMAMYFLLQKDGKDTPEEAGASSQNSQHTILPEDRAMVLATVAGLAIVSALLVLGHFQSNSKDIIEPISEPSIELRVGKDGNWFRNPNLVTGTKDWGPYADTAEVSRIRLKGKRGRADRWVLKTVTEGHRFPPGSTAYPEGHYVGTQLEVPGTYTASLNVLARPGVIYELVLERYGANGAVGRPSIARFTGTGRWQKPMTTARFGPVGSSTETVATSAVLNLLTAKRPQATTFLSYGARIEKRELP